MYEQRRQPEGRPAAVFFVRVVLVFGGGIEPPASTLETRRGFFISAVYSHAFGFFPVDR